MMQLRWPSAPLLTAMTAFLALLTAAATQAAAGAPPQGRLTLLSESDSGNSWQDRDGKLRGMAVEIVAAVMARTETPHQMQLIPWTRAYDNALKQPDTCVFGTSLTEERMPLFKWVHPLRVGGTSLFALADSKISVSSIDDLRRQGLRVGVMSNDIAESDLSRFEGLKLDSVANGAFNPAKLKAGRIDLWANARFAAFGVARRQGIAVRRVLDISDHESGLACNKATDDALIQRLNAALAELRAEGALAAIEQRYENLE